MPEQRSLLVTCDAAHRNACEAAACDGLGDFSISWAEGRTSPSASLGTPRSSHNSDDQARRSMSKQSVRLAFDGSVAWWPDSTPPVRFQQTQSSTVPSASELLGATPPYSSIHDHLVAEKYGSSTSPVRARTSGRWPASASSAHRDAVR